MLNGETDKTFEEMEREDRKLFLIDKAVELLRKDIECDHQFMVRFLLSQVREGFLETYIHASTVSDTAVDRQLKRLETRWGDVKDQRG